MSAQEPLTRRTKTPTEVAVILGVSKETVLAMIKADRLECIRFGTRFRIPDAAIARLLGESDESAA